MACHLSGKDNPNYKHGLSKHPLYRVWKTMLNRCAEHKDYKDRNITVCEEWLDFIKFYEWSINNGWHEHHGHDLSIDRIDNSSEYSPQNCRWVDAKTQARNTRKLRPIYAVDQSGIEYGFRSTTFACDFLGKPHASAAPNITACLKGRIRSAYGYAWFYDD